MIQPLNLSTSLSRLPIFVITGFLGSGKTTLLNRLLTYSDLKNSAVIINEFGRISIDHLLVQSAVEETMVVMESGCLCCTIRGDLVQALQNLFQKRARMEVLEFDRVIIETTGLADPVPIIHTLMDNPLLQTYYRLDNVITTVDAVHGLLQLDEHDETTKQIAVADHLLLTKVDLVSVNEEKTLRNRLHQLNPSAKIDHCVQGNIEQPFSIFNANLYDPTTKTINVQQWLKAETYVNPKTDQHHILHSTHIQTFCITYKQRLSWQIFNHWFQTLIALYGKDLLRMKGILNTVENDLPIIVQGIQHIIQPLIVLPAWQSAKPLSQIVFITRHLKKEAVEEMLVTIINEQE